MLGERILTTKTQKQLLEETQLLQGLLRTKDRQEEMHLEQIKRLKNQISELQRAQRKQAVVSYDEDKNNATPHAVTVPEESQSLINQEHNDSGGIFLESVDSLKCKQKDNGDEIGKNSEDLSRMCNSEVQPRLRMDELLTTHSL